MRGSGMKEEVALRPAADLHAFRAEAKLRLDSHGLAVPVHEDPAGEGFHGWHGEYLTGLDGNGCRWPIAAPRGMQTCPGTF